MKRNKLIIYNPRSGLNIKRPSIKKVLKETNSQNNCDVCVSCYKNHAQQIAKDNAERFDTIIVCGGDGTLSEVANGIFEADCNTTIGYIPTGSTNDLAKNIGLPTKFKQAAKTIATQSGHGFDIATFNDRHFLYIASFGPGVSVSFKTPQWAKNVFGYSAYIVNGFIFQLIPTLAACKPKHIKVEYDGKCVEDDFYFGTVSNALSAAGLFKFDKSQVKFNDGKFEVVLIKKLKTPLSVFPMLWKMRKHKYDDENFLHFQAQNIHFMFEKPEIWTLDGESSGAVEDVEIQILKERLNIICSPSINF